MSTKEEPEDGVVDDAAFSAEVLVACLLCCSLAILGFWLCC